MAEVTAPRGNPETSPTLTLGATVAGMILGTAAYMAPEQAAGKPVDRRADIWSFGVVLHEMLTGRRLFKGETVAHTLAAVLQTPLNFEKVNAPATIKNLLRRCLDRDLKTRLQWIGEARVVIATPGAPEPTETPAKPSSRIPWAVAAALALALSYLGYRQWSEEKPRMVKSSILPPEKTELARNGLPALSPDGRKLAIQLTAEGKTLLWVRDLDSLDARALTGTDGASNPFWSPDSQSIAFAAEGKLKRIEVAGGPALTLCTLAGNSYGGSWSTRGVILFPNSQASEMYRVPASGGTCAPATSLDPAAGDVSHRFPSFLPDGRHYLFTVRNRDAEASGIYVGDLESKDRTLVMRLQSRAAYVKEGFILFVRDLNAGPLWAQAFDPSSLKLSGDAFPVAEAIDRAPSIWAQHQFTVSNLSGSRHSVLVYQPGRPYSSQLTWVDRSGKILGLLGARSATSAVAISPDGGTVAVDRETGGASDIWLYDLARGSFSRFTFVPPGQSHQSPVWAPDGKSIVFWNEATGALVRKSLHGSGAEVTIGGGGGGPGGGGKNPALSRDGRFLVSQTRLDLFVIALDKPGEKPTPYLNSNFNELQPALAPSSDWLAYSSDESRQFEVYAQPFPTPGRKYQVSTGGGRHPVWSRDGKELYFIAPDRQMMAVPVKNNGATLEIGTPKALFDSKLNDFNDARFDVSNDGRFLIPMNMDQSAQPPITLIVNWLAGVKKN